eukprot:2061304-Rhodomonas_salina.1
MLTPLIREQVVHGKSVLVSYPTCLQTCYGMPSTDFAYGTARKWALVRGSSASYVVWQVPYLSPYAHSGGAKRTDMPTALRVPWRMT